MHHASLVIHPTPFIIINIIVRHSSFITDHASLTIHHTSFTIHHPSIIVHHTSFIIHHSSFLIPHTSYIIHLSSFIMHHSSSSSPSLIIHQFISHDASFNYIIIDHHQHNHQHLLYKRIGAATKLTSEILQFEKKT